MQYVNYDNLQNFVLETSPCKHMVIDNFLNEDCVSSVLNEMKELTSDKAYYNSCNKNSKGREKMKLAFKDNLGFCIEGILKELCNTEFIDFLEKTFDIQNIIKNSNELQGAGVHKIYNEGYLSMHKDFNFIDDKNNERIDRRINLLIYMNPNWKEDYNGHLSLFDENTQTVTNKILPILNRCVIFDTTYCIHGHPEPLVLPDGICRQSIALYYYTKNTSGSSVSKYGFHPVMWYDNIK